MSRIRWAALAVVVLAAGVAASARAVSGGGDAPATQTHLGGAELVAGLDGNVRQQPFRGDRLADLHLGGSRYDDLHAYDVRTGSDGAVYLLTGASACDDVEDCFGFVVRVDDDMVVDAAIAYADVYPGQLAIAADRRAARIGPVSRVLDFSPPQDRLRLPTLPIQPLSGGYTADGTLVASRTGGPEIVAVSPDGTVEHLLAPTDSTEPAPVRFDSETAALTLVVLPDDRIVFATNAPDDPDLDGRVFVLDDDALRPLDLPDTEPIRRIFPGPDDTLLALEGPHITQIDPDTATTDRLIDLSEVADELAPAADEWPPTQDISAAAHGNDLLFTADYQLWRLPDTFDTTSSG
jgi:hypothetical protein